MKVNGILGILTACVAVFLLSGCDPAWAVEADWGSPMNQRAVLVSTVAVSVSMVTDLNRTMVLMNDDPENTVYYGGSGVTADTGIAIGPGEKVVFHGKTAGFKIYVLTQSGATILRVVEHP